VSSRLSTRARMKTRQIQMERRNSRRRRRASYEATDAHEMTV
jgi:hypothetical protein